MEDRVAIHYYNQLQSKMQQLQSRIEKEELKQEKSRIVKQQSTIQKELKSKIVVSSADLVSIHYYNELQSKIYQLESRIEKELSKNKEKEEKIIQQELTEDINIIPRKKKENEILQIVKKEEKQEQDDLDQWIKDQKRKVEESEKIPTGLVWVQNSCYLDSLVQIFLSSDSTYLRKILLEEDPNTFVYDEKLIEKCQKNSIYESENPQRTISSLRQLANALQADLKKLMQSLYLENQSCVLIREKLSLCMRDLFEESSYSQLDVDTVEEKILMSVYRDFSVNRNVKEVKEDAALLNSIIREKESSLKKAKTISDVQRILVQSNFFSKTNLSVSNPLTMPAIARNLLKESIKKGKAAFSDPIDVYNLFARAFPSLIMSIEMAILDVEYLDVRIVNLADNPLVVLSNTFQKQDLNNILKKEMQWGNQHFSLVGIINFVNGNHYTAYILHKGKWYFYNDIVIKDSPLRFQAVDRFDPTFFTFRDNILPYMFFYARHDFIFS